MKVNVKGLVFVGFAAAILSGAAAHAAAGDQNIVTSKAYTDATYQTKIAGGEGFTDKAVIAGSTAGSPTYKSITATMPNGGLSASSSNLVTEQAVAEALAAAAGGAGSSFEVTSNKLNGTSTTGQKIGDLQAGSDAGQDQTMYPSAAAVKEYVTSTLASGGTNGDGYEQVANKAAAIVTDSSAAGYNANDPTKYASTKAVYDYVESKTGANIVTQTITAGHTTTAPSEDAVSTALAGKQNKVNGGANDTKAHVGNGDNSWLEVKDTTYVEMEKGTDGNKDVMRVQLKSGAIDNTGTAIDGTLVSGTDNANKLTTAYAVQQAIAAQATQTDTDLSSKQDNLGGTVSIGGVDTNVNGRVVTATGTAGQVTYTEIDTTVTDNSNNLITSNAVADYVAGELSNTANVGNGTLTVSVNGTANGTTFTANQTGNSTIALTNIEVTTDKLDGTTNNGIADTTSTNDTTKYPSAKAVKDYVAAQIAAQPYSDIPAQSTTVCTSTQPCALVAAADGYHWLTMATGNHQGGVCGDAGGGTCGGMGTAPTTPVQGD